LRTERNKVNLLSRRRWKLLKVINAGIFDGVDYLIGAYLCQNILKLHHFNGYSLLAYLYLNKAHKDKLSEHTKVQNAIKLQMKRFFSKSPNI
jgi:hypothetical protein